MDKMSQKNILEDIKSMCSEIIKMLDEKEINSESTQDKLIQGSNCIEEVFFNMIGEEKLSDYRNIKDNTLKKEDLIIIEDIVIEDVRTKDYVVKKISSKNNIKDLKWHHNNEDISIIPIKESEWKIQYDNQFPINLENGIEYKIKKDQYYRFIKGTGDLYLKVHKSKDTFNQKEEIPGIGESIKYHIDNKISLSNSIFRTGSLAWNELVSKAKKMNEKGRLRLNEYDKLILSTK